MVDTWSEWQRFPDPRRGESLHAPIGPGVYEVRHAPSGKQVAFGHAAHLAGALSTLSHEGPLPIWRRLLGRRPLPYRLHDLEYRTCAVATRHEARSVASRLEASRRAALSRRAGLVWT